MEKRRTATKAAVRSREDCASDLALAGSSERDEKIILIRKPRPNDILLGRGRWYARHAGNQRLQTTINRHLEKYQAAPFRKLKTDITHKILAEIKQCSKEPVARFLRHDDERNGWIPVHDDVARLKISQAIRYSIRAPSSDKQEPQPQPSSAARRKRRSSGRSSSSSLSTGNDENGSMKKSKKLKRSSSSSSSFSFKRREEAAPKNPSMPPPPPRRVTLSTMTRYACRPIAETTKMQDEVLVTDEEIYIALGYGPRPFAKKMEERE